MSSLEESDLLEFLILDLEDLERKESQLPTYAFSIPATKRLEGRVKDLLINIEMLIELDSKKFEGRCLLSLTPKSLDWRPEESIPEDYY